MSKNKNREDKTQAVISIPRWLKDEFRAECIRRGINFSKGADIALKEKLRKWRK